MAYAKKMISKNAVSTCSGILLCTYYSLAIHGSTKNKRVFGRYLAKVYLNYVHPVIFIEWGSTKSKHYICTHLLKQ